MAIASANDRAESIQDFDGYPPSSGDRAHHGRGNFALRGAALDRAASFRISMWHTVRMLSRSQRS